MRRSANRRTASKAQLSKLSDELTLAVEQDGNVLAAEGRGLREEAVGREVGLLVRRELVVRVVRHQHNDQSVEGDRVRVLELCAQRVRLRGQLDEEPVHPVRRGIVALGVRHHLVDLRLDENLEVVVIAQASRARKHRLLPRLSVVQHDRIVAQAHFAPKNPLCC